jgi:trimeric autotransporter adhesin
MHQPAPISQKMSPTKTKTSVSQAPAPRRSRFLIAVVLAGLAFAVKLHAAVLSDVFYGPQAGANVTTGTDDTAIGYFALYSDTTGSLNTASGSLALFSNTTGDSNTGTGFYTLYNNTTGSSNTASGSQALFSNTTGSNNLASGYQALYNNTTGNNNMATGASAMYGNTTGYYNMANGSFALVHNTTGNYNVAEGLNALFHNTTGSGNIAIGTTAGGNLTTGNGNIDIGNTGVAGEAATIRIGSVQTRAFLAGVRNAVVAGGVPVSVSAAGQLGTTPSSKRFKQDIVNMGEQSEAILALHPVSFHYKQDLDPEKKGQFGLVAEEVAKVNPDLVARDDKGEIYSVRYEAVNAMLLNEFLKEHRKVEEQERLVKQQDARLGQQEAMIAQQQKQIEALSAGLRQVALKIRSGEPVPRMAISD